TTCRLQEWFPCRLLFILENMIGTRPCSLSGCRSYGRSCSDWAFWHSTGLRSKKLLCREADEMRLRYYGRLWKAYMRIGLLTTTQYPADTVIWIISMLLREAAGFVGILAIASVMGSLGAWSFYEICLLFSMCAVIEAISMAFFDNVWSIDSMIR